MKLQKIIAAAAISAAWLIGAPAHAGVIGSADLAITGFLIVDANGAPVTSGIKVLSDSRTGTANSNFNNIGGVGAGLDSITSVSLLAPGGTVDVKYRCAGPSCGSVNAIYGGSAENNSTTHLAAPSGNFSLGDMLITGNALSIASPGGAKGLTRADASVMNSSNIGGSNATILNSVSAKTTFTVGTDLLANFLLGYNAFVTAFVDPVLPVGASGVASGAISWNLVLSSTDDATFMGTNALNWSPTELNQGFISTSFAENQTYAGAGFVASPSRLLHTGKTYSLTINQASNALAAQVPEPGSMVLIGLGLFALAGVARRRSK